MKTTRYYVLWFLVLFALAAGNAAFGTMTLDESPRRASVSWFICGVMAACMSFHCVTWAAMNEVRRRSEEARRRYFAEAERQMREDREASIHE